ncbi:exopolyphosphatase [Gordonibacter sp. 28C]|uniref:Ppx/GppA phosphatase family protein n=1 Tax=Gordonibacter sp. 28C TaxID=2078569 RepID=UPI000DF7680E|nr:exopolyphosphatase [Gordonibacter sp. 28C]RDB62605.1 exopolyphosphatase [Gordonibacter sp. 28C]
MPNYAVIDLGSNTIRLVVYEVKDDRRKTYTNKDFKSLINDKVMAGLSAFVTDDGAFTEDGVRRAVSVLKGHAKRARYFDCKRVDVFATAVLRNASNGAEAVAAIGRDTELPISLLSARDEAHLGFVGATCDREIERGTLVDIGGGSTELTRIEGGRDYDNVSLGQGSLSSYTSFVRAILPTPNEMDAVVGALYERLAALPDQDAYRADAIYGIGGSVRAAAKMHAQVSGEIARPKSMTAAEIRAILDLCRTDACAFAHLALKASAERVHTLVPGCLILDTLMSDFRAGRLEICKYGVREGYLIERVLG